MGRRKERRLAAMSAAGRRVKLDLCVEPSGELGGFSAQDEVGGDSDTRTHAELPNSPVSSGQQLNNPLMLLEQYSDDDLDEYLSDGQDAAAAKNQSGDLEGKMKIIGEVTIEDTRTDSVNDLPVQEVKQLEMVNDSASQDLVRKHEKEGISLNNSDDILGQTKTIEGVYAVLSEEQVGNVSLSWKKVLHEESNQYYYWNILTGETSWEVPDVLAQSALVNYPEKAVGDTSFDMEQEDATTEKLNKGTEANHKTSCHSNQGTESGGFEEGCKGDSLGNAIGNADASQNGRTSFLDDTVVVNEFSGDYKSVTDFSMLVKHCDILLQRLRSLESLNCNPGWQDFRLKSELEVEIRLFDINALASHGPALHHFWLHTEDQLKRLDAAIEDASQHYDSASAGEPGVAVEPQEAIINDSNERKGMNQEPKEFNHLVCSSEKSHIEAYTDVATSSGLVSSVFYPTMFPNTETEGKTEISGPEMQSELISKSVHHSGEEVDMDVDMEVEDASSSLKSSIGGASGAQYQVLSGEQSNLQNPSAIHEHMMLGQMFSIQPPVGSWIHPLSLGNEPCPPPPPDNDPFPPPPPDDYPFPPPPPEEPPEASCPPTSNLESVHALPYSEQYVVSYPSGLEYYVQSNTEISGTTPYAHPEGVQVSVSHIPPYYETVPNVYAVAPLVGNPGEPVSYYGLQNGNLNPVSLVSAFVEPSRIQSETALTNRDSDNIRSLDSNPEIVYGSFPKVDLNVAKSGQGPVKEPEVSDAVPVTGSQSATSAAHSVTAALASDVPSVVSSSSAAAAALAATSKVQSKVSRGKKRTGTVMSTLRSNKKVSSLVDKWKAAKEELHEEEEEPENAYEMLERKRRREIEEWQAQQIASGEAKVNANFQPLGGDWRERVKQKRAMKMKETEHKVSKTTGLEEPDIVELSRDLPSGWQAYWDASSKRVYYGNMATSETTWTKPKD